MTQPRMPEIPPLPYYRAPAALRGRIEAAIRRAPAHESAARRFAPMLGMAAAVVLATLLGWRLGDRHGAATAGTASVVSAHLRSLTPNRLMDVASSDQHTVKPWFAGKLDFSPPVVDASAAGFPLSGGRVDFVEGRPAAALVYTRRRHVINVFIQPLAAGDDAGELREDRLGINVLRWSDGGMRYWAVSDLNMAELQQLRALLEPTH